MAVQTSYPGVYIDEFAPGAPIEGVGTSTAAFIGPTALGDINEPTKVTSWDQFRQRFGEQPLPGFFVWYAVRGFFENGGQVCYVVRASNGSYGRIDLEDRAATPNQVIRLRARQPGALAINVAVAERHVVPNTTRLYQPTAALAAAPAGRDLRLAADGGTAAEIVAARFRPGDWITVAGGTDRVQVVRVTGDTLRIGADLSGGPYGVGATVRLADAIAGTRTFRLLPAAPLPATAIVPGTILTITQGAASTSQIVESVQTEYLLGGVTTYRVTFRQGVPTPITLAPPPPATNAASVQSEEFAITVQLGAGTVVYDNLSIDPAHPRYFEQVINDDVTGLVRAELRQPPPPVAPPASLPRNLALTVLPTLGATENLAALTALNYTNALDALRRIDDVNLVACPDAVATLNAANSTTVQQAMITHCEQLADRFAVLDSRPGAELFGTGSVDEHRNAVDSSRGYAALYYPWLRVPRAGSGDPMLAPPSGHVCGIIARSDSTRGVHKAPANELVNGALGVERVMSDIDQGQLNLRGVNVLRVFSTGGRVTLWGARTTATDRNWQYVNIRRLFLYLEESIEEGIRWSVFEPNNLGLWQKLRRTITEFLTRAWRDGALFGATPEEAFYVRIDDVLNPFSEQALGRLHIEVGVRPTYPAEFIIVRIGIWQGGKEVTEG